MSDTLGQSGYTRFHEDAIAQMREAIVGAGGNEVFFAGTITPSGMVSGVRVCARGHEGAVPAVFEGLQSRDVVIHNHPSGVSEPSEADRGITLKLGRALALVDVRLLDHLVVSRDGHVSLAERGWI